MRRTLLNGTVTQNTMKMKLIINPMWYFENSKINKFKNEFNYLFNNKTSSRKPYMYF